MTEGAPQETEPAAEPRPTAAPSPRRLTSAEIEAANRAEATALLIRAGYRVYRPEADVSGEDLIIRTPTGMLRPVQLKGRPSVEWARYGGQGLWMLFPDPDGPLTGLPRSSWSCGGDTRMGALATA